MDATEAGVFMMEQAEDNEDRVAFLVAAISTAMEDGMRLQELLDSLRRHRDPSTRVRREIAQTLRGL